MDRAEAAEAALADVRAKFDAYVEQDWTDYGIRREPPPLTAESVEEE
jgi:hypothetical protein